jgi:hypothetical protein
MIVKGWVDKRWKGIGLPIIWSTAFGNGTGKTKEVIIYEAEQINDLIKALNELKGNLVTEAAYDLHQTVEWAIDVLEGRG